MGWAGPDLDASVVVEHIGLVVGSREERRVQVEEVCRAAVEGTDIGLVDGTDKVKAGRPEEGRSEAGKPEVDIVRDAVDAAGEKAGPGISWPCPSRTVC